MRASWRETITLALLGCTIFAAAVAQAPETRVDEANGVHGSVQTPGVRHVVGQTLTSSAMPAMRLRLSDAFRYAGTQSFVLYGNSHVEQHFFVDADEHKLVRRLYWVHFEGYLPDNSLTYDYKSTTRIRIGGLDFIADGFVRSDDTPDRPDSDTARAKIFLASKGYRMAGKEVLVERLVHLVGRDRRNELMILYVESPAGKAATVPGGAAGTGSSDPLAGLLERAIGNLSITPYSSRPRARPRVGPAPS